MQQPQQHDRHARGDTARLVRCLSMQSSAPGCGNAITYAAKVHCSSTIAEWVPMDRRRWLAAAILYDATGAQASETSRMAALPAVQTLPPHH
jgi:hypothetical protein